MVKHTRTYAGIAGMLLLMSILSGGLVVAQDAQQCGTESGEGCAPESERVDLYEPSFSNPTQITHPLFPASTVAKTLLVGHVDGQPLHVEYTRLPEPRIIEWNGQQIETVEVQYLAHLDGRIIEVALDWYAQDDQGAVWYFGENVFNYEEGVVADTEGTWLAGRDGPVAMIMPANPQVGDVYRVENIPGLVFEEVTVAATGMRVNGPLGPVDGAIIVQELHMDGEIENKTFAPGYGEFVTTNPSELEALALAVPTDAVTDSLPDDLETLSSGADSVFDAAEAEGWDTIVMTLGEMSAAWDTFQTGNVPRLLDAQMSDALIELVAAIDVRQPEDVRRAAVQVAQASLDFQLLYQPLAESELARFDLWTRQVLVDAVAEESADVLSDVTTLEWTWDRLVPLLDGDVVGAVETQLGNLRTAADEESFDAVADAAQQLRDLLAGVELSS